MMYLHIFPIEQFFGKNNPRLFYTTDTYIIE